MKFSIQTGWLLGALLGLFTFSGVVAAQAMEPNAPLLMSEVSQALTSFELGRAAYAANDFPLAAEAFHRAADLGHTEAQYMYALMLYRGQGMGTADWVGAARYYLLSARGDFAKAQYNLAVLYYEGKGVARNDLEAYKWLYLAGKNGEPRAQKMLPVADRNLSPELRAKAISELENSRMTAADSRPASDAYAF